VIRYAPLFLLAACNSFPPESKSYLKLDYKAVRKMVQSAAPKGSTVWMHGLNDSVPVESDEHSYLRIFDVRTSGPLDRSLLRRAFTSRIKRYGGKAKVDHESDRGFTITYTAESKKEVYTPVRKTITYKLTGFVELTVKGLHTYEIMVREAKD
jgi:hypothetical protein